MKKIFKYSFFLLIGSVILIIIFYNFLKWKFSLQGEIKDRLTLSISFAAIFATFGGAYLGAKISGDITRKLAKKERTIKDINDKYKKNKLLIDEFYSLNKDINRYINLLKNVFRSQSNFQIRILKINEMQDRLLMGMYSLYLIKKSIKCYEKECLENNLNGKEVSPIILKEIESIKLSIKSIEKKYETLKNFNSENIYKYIQKKGERNNEKRIKVIKIIYDNFRLEIKVEKVEIKDDQIKSSNSVIKFKDYLDFIQRTKGMDKVFRIANTIYIYYSLKKHIYKYSWKNNRLKFKDEQDLINYLNSLYSSL